MAFAGFIDYAGLYPPASLPLDDVIRRYGRYRSDPTSWMLGRLILPANRLGEANALATRAGASPVACWPVSLLVGRVEEVAAGERALAQAANADTVLGVESIEATADTVAQIAALAAAYPSSVERFVEIPAEPDPAPLMSALAERNCLAKLRTGGVTADRFPSTSIVARFMARAASARVAIKATAGLHHAIRASHPMTYAADSPTGAMQGFANLAFAAALLCAGKIDEELTDALLDDDRPEVFKFGGRAASWLNAVVTYGEFAEARLRLLRSVGSCSFEEPVEELYRLGWTAAEQRAMNDE